MLYAVQSVHDSSLYSIHRAILMVSQSKKEDNKSVKKSTKKYSICFSLTSQLTISNPSRLLSIIQLAMKYSYEHVSIDLCSSPTQNELPSVPLFDIYQNIVPEEKNIQESYPSISVSFFSNSIENQCGTISLPQGSYPLVATISKGATVFVGSFFPSITSIWQQVPLMDSLKYIFSEWK